MKYKLRNGIIVEKIAYDGHLGDDPLEIDNPKNGWYNIIDKNQVTFSEEVLCLLTNESKNPLDHTGGTHGENYNVMGLVEDA